MIKDPLGMCLIAALSFKQSSIWKQHLALGPLLHYYVQDGDWNESANP
jgi:hypothetical protein